MKKSTKYYYCKTDDNKIEVVSWSENRWFFERLSNREKLDGYGADGFYIFTYKLNKKMKVIGNIYENPKLLN